MINLCVIGGGPLTITNLNQDFLYLVMMNQVHSQMYQWLAFQLPKKDFISHKLFVDTLYYLLVLVMPEIVYSRELLNLSGY